MFPLHSTLLVAPAGLARLARFFFACIAALLLAAGLPAQTDTVATGTVTGRVFNAATNAALRNARVTVTGTTREIITDSDGAFLFEGVPAGEVRVTVSYIGLATETATLTLSPGGRAERDFDLYRESAARTDGQTEDRTIVLDKFTVVADQELSAQAVALNERLAAPNIKQVVAYDEYGDKGGENIGEFLRYLPGVGIEDGGQLASSVTLRGFPSANTNIQLDGADVAGARGNGRTQSVLDIPMANVERVEISKSASPDAPASGMGGSINLITKTAFSAKKPVFNYRTYYIFDSKDGITVDGGPRGLSDKLSPSMKQPSFDFSYILPVNKKFGLTFGGSRTWRLKPMERDADTDTQVDWNYVTGVQRAATWFSLDNIYQSWGAQIGADWKISDRDVLSLGLQHRYASNNIMRESVVINYGAGATGDATATFVQGATTGVGSVNYAAGPNQETGSDTTHATLKYTHRERDWRIEANGAFSMSETFLDDLDNGHFNDMSSTISNLIIRGEGRGEDDALIPVRYTATTRTGTPINLFDGGNATLGNPTSAQNHVYAEKFTGRLDFTREFGGRIPFTLKTGLFVESLNRRAESEITNFTFTPNGSTAAAGRLASLFPVFDEEFLATAPTIFGQPVRFISVREAYQLYQANPSWFPVNQATTHNSRAQNSREITETVSAAYIRGDAHFFNRRLWVTGGLRFERTTDDGTGVKTDPTAIYQKDANGNYILNSSGQRILITTDLYEQAKLTNVKNGTSVKKSYDDLYPSVNLTYYLTPKLLARAAAYVTIGRPNLNFITPGVTITDSTSSNPTITVNNTALLPQEAVSYELSLESYQVKGGQGSIGIFQKDINNFFGVLTQDATPELLAFYNLPDDPVYLNYDIVTRTNAGDAKIIGYEVGYKQSLIFLPDWARGIAVFVNGTKLELTGSNTADFTGFVPETYSGGIELVRPRYYVKLNFTYQGETRGTAVGVSTANGIPAGTYNYQGERLRIALSASYSFSKKFSVFGSITDIDGTLDVVNRQYPDGIAEYMKDRRRQELGATITLGVKGTF